MSDEKPIPLVGTINIPISIQGKETAFHCQITAPGPMAAVEDLEKALVRNRDLLNKSHKDMIDNLKKDYFERAAPWLLNYEGPVQNALVARFNINVLIPLINMKGGEAEFTKIESWPVKKHVEKMMVKAEKAALEYQIIKAAPFNYAFAISMIVAAFVILYVTVV